MESPSRMGGTDVSDVPDSRFTKGNIGYDPDDAVASGGRGTFEISSSEADIFDQLHMVTAGDQKGTVTEGNIHFHSAIIGNFLHAGQVNSGFAEGHVDGTGA